MATKSTKDTKGSGQRRCGAGVEKQARMDRNLCNRFKNFVILVDFVAEQAFMARD